MKNRYFYVSAICFSLFVSSFAKADDPGSTGNDWYQLCSGKPGSRPEACGVYAMGVASGATAQAGITGSKQIFCAPRTVNYLQLADIFYKYLEDHPEQRHINAVALALRSWQIAFPCEINNQK